MFPVRRGGAPVNGAGNDDSVKSVAPVEGVPLASLSSPCLCLRMGDKLQVIDSVILAIGLQIRQPAKCMAQGQIARGCECRIRGCECGIHAYDPVR